MTLNPILLYDRWTESRLTPGEATALYRIRTLLKHYKLTFTDANRIAFTHKGDNNHFAAFALELPFNGTIRFSMHAASFDGGGMNDRNLRAVVAVMALEGLLDDDAILFGPRLSRLVIKAVTEAISRHHRNLEERSAVEGFQSFADVRGAI